MLIPRPGKGGGNELQATDVFAFDQKFALSKKYFDGQGHVSRLKMSDLPFEPSPAHVTCLKIIKKESQENSPSSSFLIHSFFSSKDCKTRSERISVHTATAK